MNVQIYLKNQIHTIIQLLKNNTREHIMKIIAKNSITLKSLNDNKK